MFLYPLTDFYNVVVYNCTYVEPKKYPPNKKCGVHAVLSDYSTHFVNEFLFNSTKAKLNFCSLMKARLRNKSEVVYFLLKIIFQLFMVLSCLWLSVNHYVLKCK